MLSICIELQHESEARKNNNRKKVTVLLMIVFIVINGKNYPLKSLQRFLKE